MRQRSVGFHQESWRRLYVNKKRREVQSHRQRGGSGLDHTEEPDVCRSVERGGIPQTLLAIGADETDP
jgi:hypothetical protein